MLVQTAERPASSSNDPLQLVGTLVEGRYLVERAVGSGGFGVVYKAHHVRFEAPVALKVLFPDVSGFFPSSNNDAAKVAPEARLLFELGALHPSFVRVIEAGRIVRRAEPPLSYYAMEWLEGWTLRSYVDALRRSGSYVPMHSALLVFEQLVEALEILHARRISHRDLKPANVILSSQGERIVPKLLDFGIAKVGGAANAFTDTVRPSGPFTPAYAAPEQWDCRMGPTGPWTDVYSLALLLSEVLTKHGWCESIDRSVLANSVLDPERRPTPRTLGLDIGDAIEQVFSRALAVDPRERYPDVAHFWRELRTAAQWRHPGRPLVAEDLGIAMLLPSGSSVCEHAETLSVEPSERIVARPAEASNSGSRGVRTRAVSSRLWALAFVGVGVAALSFIGWRLGVPIKPIRPATAERPLQETASRTHAASGPEHRALALPTMSRQAPVDTGPRTPQSGPGLENHGIESPGLSESSRAPTHTHSSTAAPKEEAAALTLPVRTGAAPSSPASPGDDRNRLSAPAVPPDDADLVFDTALAARR